MLAAWRPEPAAWVARVARVLPWVFAASVLAADPPPQRVDRSLSGWPVDDFVLLDQSGEPFTQDDLAGRWTLLLLGDRRWGATCSASLAALAGLYRGIAGTKAALTTQVVYVSLDARDAPAELGRYLASYDARFIGVGGPREILNGLAQDLGVSLPSPPAAEDGGAAGSIWLIGPDRVIRARLIPPFDVPRLTAAYLKMRARR